ncbi:DUF7933 domain-containing protein [Diaphorobacter aerolatus]|uniref:DUF11 domain-containing protein n=1 Tax=Diaphorobacter aerolatus TaxID=1288495 RepID=A0A7H0GKP5_9BURK|nr:DUF11 domain-containing protein [Diaphorobacter aerolatus]QNP48861.1 DUF11 domain-containing protein [Diaphorobacter aerolatus]
MNPLVGGDVTYFNGVPANNALYLAPGSTQPAPGTTVDGVYGLLIPQTQSYGGTGACLFATVDLTPFDAVYNDIYGTQNAGKIAPAFLNAIAAGGSCGIPASISKAFSQTSVLPGGTSTLTITVHNTATSAVPGLNVTDTLPSPLVIADAATTTCTGGTLVAASDSNSVSLSGAALPVGGCTITVPVSWPVAQAALCAAPGTTVTNVITPGTDFTTSLGQSNTPATAALTCLGEPPVIPPAGTVTKAFSQTSVLPGGTATLTITVQNSSSAAVAGLNVKDALPSPLVISGAATTTCTGGTLVAASGSSNVSLSGATLPVGGCTITVPVSWPVAQAAMCAAPAPR